MPLGNKFGRALAASLTCAALLAGCSAGHGRKIHMPQMHWPQCWPKPTTIFSRSTRQAEPHEQYQEQYQGQGQPEYLPMPADPNGSPYPPNSPREYYVPNGPAPRSKLGLPVPPPLPPGSDDPAPIQQKDEEALPVPPVADDMDVSFDARRPRRSNVVPPPPPLEADETQAPRIAERTDTYDRRRQPVGLELPEPDFEFPRDASLDKPGRERSPADSFPQPRLSDEDLERGPGHTPPFDNDDLEEKLPMGIDPSGHRPIPKRGAQPGPLPSLSDPDEADLSFPGGNRQMSGVSARRFAKVDAAVSGLSVERFRLTRDARTGDDITVLNARNLQLGQGLVVQADIRGLEKIERSGELVSRVTCHVEIRDSDNKVVARTEDKSAAEVTQSARSTRHVSQWMKIPARLKAGDYVLQFHVKDDIARQVTVVEMPVTVKP